MRNFRELRIWEDSIKLVKSIYVITSSFPNSELYGLTSQMNRSAVSIPSNIAEGCRGSARELNQFLTIALGSSFELETQLIICQELGIIQKHEGDNLLNDLNTLQKQINSFRTKIKE